jgi:hypothetical protein
MRPPFLFKREAIGAVEPGVFQFFDGLAAALGREDVSLVLSEENPFP